MGGCSERNLAPGMLEDGHPAILGTAPHFESRTLEGAAFSAREFKGKTTLLTFWASWCAQCKPELRSLNLLATEKRPAGLQIIAVAVDDDLASAIAFVHKNSLTFPVIFDRAGELKSQFKITSVPTTLLIDEEARIREIRDPQSAGWVPAILGPRRWDIPEARLWLVHTLLHLQ